MKYKYWRLYWRDGKTQVITGDTIGEAIRDAGYGGGAMRALDFWDYGEQKKYTWKDNKWEKGPSPENVH